MIILNNVDKDSYLHTFEMTFKGSAGSNTVGHNIGVCPISCHLDDLIIGTTASAIAYVGLAKANNVSQATYSVGALAASGGAQLIAGPTSPALITAGTLLSIDLSATATIAEIVGTLRLIPARGEK